MSDAQGLKPTDGFDWSMVRWNDKFQMKECSYCDGPLSVEDRVVGLPLFVFRQNPDVMATFCEDCKRAWWGFKDSDQPQGEESE